MLPLLININDAVSYNDKDKVYTITVVFPKLSKYITHYVSHCLPTKVKFVEIYSIIMAMNTEPSIVYMVPYHNQKVLHMRFCEVQVDYFGNVKPE